MSGATGQASRWVVRLLRWLLGLVLFLGAAGVFAVLALEWRLSQGPLDLPGLAHWAERRAGEDGIGLRIGTLRIEANAWADGPGAPFTVRVADAAVDQPGGGIRAAVPEAALSLALPPLLTGEIRPRTLDARGLRLAARRSKAAGEAAGGGNGGGGTSPEAILAALAHPEAEARGNGVLAILSGLRRVSLRDTRASVVDARSGVTASFTSDAIELSRAEAGGLSGTADLAATTGGQTVRTALAATLGGNGETDVRLTLEPLLPAQWAGVAPELAPLAAFAAPVSAVATATLGADLGLRAFRVDAKATPGTALIDGNAVEMLGAAVVVGGTLERVAVETVSITLRGRPEGRPTTIGVSGEAALGGGKLGFRGTLTLDRAAFADLPLLWPKAVAFNARRWITTNITAGLARDARVDFAVTAPLDFSDADLTEATGGLEGEDLVVWWLRPIPPLERGRATLRILDPDTLEVIVHTARERPIGARLRDPRAGLIARSGTVRITGIMGTKQIGYISADIAGPLPDALALLTHPRLKLLKSLPLKDPSGRVQVRLKLNVPLEDAVDIDEIPLRALARLEDVRIADVFAGKNVERGVADLDITAQGMSGFGSATALGIPLAFGVDMDFRAGPPDQVLYRATLAGRGSIAQLAEAGLDARDAMSGVVGMRSRLALRRDGRGSVELRANLTDVALTAAPLNWRKEAGVPASGAARIELQKYKLQSLTDLVLTGPMLDVRGSATFAENGPTQLRFDSLRIGQSDLAGSVSFPAKPGAGPIAAKVSGPVLDVSGWLGGESKKTSAPKKPKAEPEPENTPWSIDARFDRVLTGRSRDLTGVELVAEDDGTTLRRLHVRGDAGPGASIRADLVPDGVQRRLTGAANDVGTLLASFGIEGVAGGVLTLDATYDDTLPDRPLSGLAAMGPFRITAAPFSARLLKAVTIYGIADLLRGPGIGVSSVSVPFRLTKDVLDLGDSKAVSPALGVTATGQIHLRTDRADVRGTVVPFYMLNALPGKIPVIGHWFTAEPDGGLFAVGFRVSGPLSDPDVSVNPLSLLTPGALRRIW